jgi:hypothetical protein
MKDSTISNPIPGVTLTCISPEARDLLDLVMAEWYKYLTVFKQTNGQDCEPSQYGFTYWLIRYSGLVEPSETAKNLMRPTSHPGAEGGQGE